MKFTKMQGCGNDYIYVNCFEEEVPDPSGLAVRLSDRHFGIGSDGLILIEPSERADAYMHMFNLDGSEGSMCGNGIRCVAKYIYDHGLIPADRCSARIDTGSGVRDVTLDIQNGKVANVTVDMGIARTRGGCPEETRIGDLQIKYYGIDTGNPHAVVFIEDNSVLNGIAGCSMDCSPSDVLAALPLETIGPVFEYGTGYPGGVNTEFISVTGRSEIEMRVWERGSGETLACGTGAVASAAAGCLAGKLDSEVLVHLAGGDLRISVDTGTGRCVMTGPAEEVFTGSVRL